MEFFQNVGADVAYHWSTIAPTFLQKYLHSFLLDYCKKEVIFSDTFIAILRFKGTFFI